MKTNQTTPETNATNDTRAVRLFFCGPRCFGVFAEEIESIADWRELAPLPDAPQSVLGVASLRGRMFTVIDAAVLLSEPPAAPKKIVTLRGDEQLALAVSGAGDVIEVKPNELENASDADPFVRGLILQTGRSVAILDSLHLFPAAMRGRERRRRRF